VRWGAIGLLALITGLRSWVFLGTVNFIPKMFLDMGWSATDQGALVAVYWLASGVTGVIGGNLADRWGRRQVVFVTLLLGSLPVYFLPLNDNWLAFALAIISGGLLGASHSILIVIAQALVPGRAAFASGVSLGYLFAAGAVAAWIIGSLADVWGLGLVIQAGAAVGLLAALLAFFLPSTRETSQPQPERVPA
jgi:FSR family fosmidomycin resistance protein-like MFS transporter